MASTLPFTPSSSILLLIFAPLGRQRRSTVGTMASTSPREQRSAIVRTVNPDDEPRGGLKLEARPDFVLVEITATRAIMFQLTSASTWKFAIGLSLQQLLPLSNFSINFEMLREVISKRKVSFPLNIKVKAWMECKHQTEPDSTFLLSPHESLYSRLPAACQPQKGQVLPLLSSSNIFKNLLNLPKTYPH